MDEPNVDLDVVRRLVRRWARCKLHDALAAEEIADLVAFKLELSLAAERPPKDLRGWLAKVTRDCIVDRQRGTKPRRKDLDLMRLKAPKKDPMHSLMEDWRRQLERLEPALLPWLTERQRRCYVAIRENHSLHEAADAAGEDRHDLKRVFLAIVRRARKLVQLGKNS